MFSRMKHKYIARQDRTPGNLNSSNKNQSKRVFYKPYLSANRTYLYQQEGVIETFLSTSQLPVNIATHL
ncbi:hypothetical protein AAJ76_3310001240 [Vairimorpha ceranae]|uniref:Uncharacterized protein n=1 Tax=Vairimorpha ceranae TaxID=40302 RepID=A0A0F9W769_9MICR|nr:hypothetical protein AAJ76_3310001240 [Vairimorpha ceranae]KKO73666.1 hypothetical protein AAJ76_3310001240 [Vairimorpha ceranae]